MPRQGMQPEGLRYYAGKNIFDHNNIAALQAAFLVLAYPRAMPWAIPI
jgi:hypothetical protein